MASKLEAIYFFQVYRFIWITYVGLNIMIQRKRGSFETDAQRKRHKKGRRVVTTEAETRVMWPHAKDGWKKPKMGSPENGRSKDFFLP